MAGADIKAIITDLGGVLIDVDKERTCTGFAKHSALSLAQIRKHFSPTVMKGHEIELGTGKISPKRFYELVSRDLRLKGLNFNAFDKIFAGRFTRKEGTLTIVKKLSRKYPVALLSNTNEMHYPYWSKVLGGDMNLFKELILSFQVGLMKPDKEMFLAAAERLKVKPEQCVFIDDVQEYVEAARKAGMRGIRFTSAAQLETDLKGLGVSI